MNTVGRFASAESLPSFTPSAAKLSVAHVKLKYHDTMHILSEAGAAEIGMTVQNDFSQWLARICAAAVQAASGNFHQEKPSESRPETARLDLLREHLRRQAHLRRLLALTCVEVMRAPVISVTADQTIGEALNLLIRHRIKLLPVVTGHTG